MASEEVKKIEMVRRPLLETKWCQALIQMMLDYRLERDELQAELAAAKAHDPTLGGEGHDVDHFYEDDPTPPPAEGCICDDPHCKGGRCRENSEIAALESRVEELDKKAKRWERAAGQHYKNIGLRLNEIEALDATIAELRGKIDIVEIACTAYYGLIVEMAGVLFDDHSTSYSPIAVRNMYDRTMKEVGKNPGSDILQRHHDRESVLEKARYKAERERDEAREERDLWEQRHEAAQENVANWERMFDRAKITAHADTARLDWLSENDKMELIGTGWNDREETPEAKWSFDDVEVTGDDFRVVVDRAMAIATAAGEGPKRCRYCGEADPKIDSLNRMTGPDKGWYCSTPCLEDAIAEREANEATPTSDEPSSSEADQATTEEVMAEVERLTIQRDKLIVGLSLEESRSVGLYDELGDALEPEYELTEREDKLIRMALGQQEADAEAGRRLPVMGCGTRATLGIQHWMILDGKAMVRSLDVRGEDFDNPDKDWSLVYSSEQATLEALREAEK